MRLAHTFAHLLIPRESNNQKAKILHSSSILLLTLFLIFYQVVINNVTYLGPRILGYAANINPEEVVRLTNEKRIQSGLSPLKMNSNLAEAALAKGTDMINRDYWAHISPDGTQPWKFFSDAGYKYRYAGENLARDFSNPNSAVEAWMASPSHRENLLSDKYNEIGIAVVEGDLAGVDTTIIVQLFGTPYTDTLPTIPIAQAKSNSQSPVPAAASAKPNPTPAVYPVTQISYLPNTIPTSRTVISNIANSSNPSGRILISPFNSIRGMSLVIVGVLLLVLVLDGLVTSKRRIARIGGRMYAHLSFLGMIFLIILILRAGQIL